MTGFVEVDASTVPLAQRRAAAAALAFARRDLGLGPIAVRWIDRAAPGQPSLPGRLARIGIAGFCYDRDDRSTWIRRGLSPVGTATVVLHEAFHAAQRSTLPPSDQTTDREAAAYAYAAAHERLCQDMAEPGWPQSRRRKASRR